MVGSLPHAHTGKSGGQVHGLAWAAKNSFTIRSSSEWKLMTARIPPDSSRVSASGRARRRLPSSSLTAMRRAWNTRRAGLREPKRAGAGMASLMVSTSSAVRV